VFVAEGTLLNHKLSFTIFDQNNKSIATIYNASENKQAASELHLDNGTIYTLEKINRKERHTSNHLFTMQVDSTLIYLERMQSNYSFAIMMNDNEIATITRKVLQFKNTFHIKYDERSFQHDAELLFFFMTIILDQRKIVLIDNVADFLL